jgi:hypothetical protein
VCGDHGIAQRHIGQAIERLCGERRDLIPSPPKSAAHTSIFAHLYDSLGVFDAQPSVAKLLWHKQSTTCCPRLSCRVGEMRSPSLKRHSRRRATTAAAVTRDDMAR